jgi:predicted TPR repeat methyltransferase
MTNSKQDEYTSELHKVYASKSSKETSSIYDDWSEEYEKHMKSVGYAHPAMVTSMLTRHQPAGNTPVLDAGSGTGIMGELMTALGYSNIAGLDASEGMVAHAATKGIYQDLRYGLLGQPLGYDDDEFTATVASGVFTQGHAPLDGLDELIRVTQPGGHIVFSIGPAYIGDSINNKAQALEDAGKWHKVDASRPYDSTPLGDDVLMAQVFAFAVV